MPKQRKRNRTRKIIRIPDEYFEALDLANIIFPSLYQLENGLRLVINNFLGSLYGPDWWEVSLKKRFPGAYKYAVKQQEKRDAMPWLGDSTRISLLPIHLLTIGLLEEIVKEYRSECIPGLFPTMEFFLGHMEVVKRVRNFYAHMFPCITKDDCKVVKREIATLSIHINSHL